MSGIDAGNLGFIECWNEILTPKWMRFRHLLAGNGAVHSARALPHFGIRPGDRVLDIGCGCGETCLEIGRAVGAEGEVLGIDCTRTFLDVANAERDLAQLSHVRYVLGDAQAYELPRDHFDVAFSRFGVMFFESAVRALRNARRALKPGGKVGLIVWRRLSDNPAWGAAKEIALRHLPPPGEDAKTCGPGPFSMADEQTDRDMLAAAGFCDPEFFRIDAEICVGRTIDEAIDFQILVGPSGEIVREAGEEGKRKLPDIQRDLHDLLAAHVRSDGVWMASSSWAIVARKPE
jgi:SAM-dependent methyltransferase